MKRNWNHPSRAFRSSAKLVEYQPLSKYLNEYKATSGILLGEMWVDQGVWETYFPLASGPSSLIRELIFWACIYWEQKMRKEKEGPCWKGKVTRGNPINWKKGCKRINLLACTSNGLWASLSPFASPITQRMMTGEEKTKLRSLEKIPKAFRCFSNILRTFSDYQCSFAMIGLGPSGIFMT